MVNQASLFFFSLFFFSNVARVKYFENDLYKSEGRNHPSPRLESSRFEKTEATITEHFLKPRRLPPSINVNQRKLEAFFPPSLPPLSGGCLTGIYVGVAGAEPSLRAG